MQEKKEFVLLAFSPTEYQLICEFEAENENEAIEECRRRYCNEGLKLMMYFVGRVLNASMLHALVEGHTIRLTLCEKTRHQSPYYYPSIDSFQYEIALTAKNVGAETGALTV